VPSSVTVVEHLTDFVDGLLICHTLVLEDEHDVAVLALDKVLAVGA
jgi:hypothetical protein